MVMWPMYAISKKTLEARKKKTQLVADFLLRPTKYKNLPYSEVTDQVPLLKAQLGSDGICQMGLTNQMV